MLILFPDQLTLQDASEPRGSSSPSHPVPAWCYDSDLAMGLEENLSHHWQMLSPFSQWLYGGLEMWLLAEGLP